MPGTPVNLYGKRFGRWTAIEPQYKDKHHNWMWLCRCDCGIEKTIKAANLTSGKTKSCKCLLREIVSVDWTGKRVGMLTILERISSNHHTYYRCGCDCGNEITIDYQSLRQRHINNQHTNCGCIRGGWQWRRNRTS